MNKSTHVPNKKDKTLFPKFKPYYTAQKWYDISLKAYKKRKEFYEKQKDNDTHIVKNDVTTIIVLVLITGHVGYCLYAFSKSVFFYKPTDFVPKDVTGKPVKLSIIDWDWLYPHITSFSCCASIIILISFIAYLKKRTEEKEIKMVKNAIDPVTVVCIVTAIIFLWWNKR